MEEDEYEESQEFSIAEVSKNLPEDLAEDLSAYIDTCGLTDLHQVNAAMDGLGQLNQLMILSEYSVLQFGILLTILQDQDLVLAEDAKQAVAVTADILRRLSGHLELLIAPKTRH